MERTPPRQIWPNPGMTRLPMDRPFKKIIIVGAGPSGLLLALLLAKHGIDVHILEASHELDRQPRAAVYGPPAIPDLKKAGIIDEVRRRGLVLHTMCWRNFDDGLKYMAGFDGAALSDVDGNDWRLTSLALQELDQLMLDLFLKEHNGTISWKHKVVGVQQDADKAWVDVETPEGPKKFEADYILGCDGATSIVRKSLFGQEYPGFTWETPIVATNVYYDFDKYGFHDVNFIVHPEHFYMACKLAPDGLYRVTYGEPPGLTLEQMKERQPWKFETMLPGNPKPGEYKMVNFAPYKMHQRCAPSFRVGRVMLVADAAHLCNPWGGMGITGGFVDAGGLYDCLIGIWEGKAHESILDLYSEKRIEKWKTVIDPISQDNFRRVADADPGSMLDRDEWLQQCKKCEGDAGLTKDLLMGFFEVRYDFTQHYNIK